MPSKKRKKGDIGEEVAFSYLKNKGYKILARNYSNKFGEIDIVAQKDEVIVFVEVKSQLRPISDGLYPERNVTYSKQRKLVRAAQRYLIEKKHHDDVDWQIDVMGVCLNEETRLADLRHLKNAISKV